MMPEVKGLSTKLAHRTRRGASLLGVRPRPRLTEGPPAHVSQTDLESLCDRLLGAPLASVQHQHTSGWKASGAYRVVLATADGSSREVFCKINDHRPEEIAALRDFPVRVGPPELAVLAAGLHGDIGDHLPRLHSYTRHDPERTTLYMESLGRTWHSCTTWPRDIIRASAEAATIQRLLLAQLGDSPPRAFIRYDRNFSEELHQYALTRLKRYSTHVGDPVVDCTLSRWSEVADACLSVDRPIPVTIVHGDFNLANVFMHVSRRRMKVLDWEWAGVGDGYRDLAALLKRAPERVERDALIAYHGVAGGSPDWRRYQKSQVERGLLDAAFLAVQSIEAASPPRMNLPRFIQTSLRRALTGLDELVTA